jgi:hypothetical protein
MLAANRVWAGKMSFGHGRQGRGEKSPPAFTTGGGPASDARRLTNASRPCDVNRSLGATFSQATPVKKLTGGLEVVTVKVGTVAILRRLAGSSLPVLDVSFRVVVLSEV